MPQGKYNTVHKYYYITVCCLFPKVLDIALHCTVLMWIPCFIAVIYMSTELVSYLVFFIRVISDI